MSPPLALVRNVGTLVLINRYRHHRNMPIRNANTICQQLLPERFWKKVRKTRSCWLWLGGISDGYGLFWWGGRTVAAHRLLWEKTVGPVPPGYELDHRCRRRACVNPEHLRAVTHRENLLAGAGFVARNAAKQTCPNGHPYDITFSRKNGVNRRCRRCTNAWATRRYYKKKSARLLLLAPPEPLSQTS